jgi:hypothetical protein
MLDEALDEMNRLWENANEDLWGKSEEEADSDDSDDDEEGED